MCKALLIWIHVALWPQPKIFGHGLVMGCEDLSLFMGSGQDYIQTEVAVLRFRAACGCLIPSSADALSIWELDCSWKMSEFKTMRFVWCYAKWAWSHQSEDSQEAPSNQTALGVLYKLHVCTLLHTEHGKYCEKIFPSQDLVLRIEAKKPWGLKRTYFHGLSGCPHNKVVESWEGIALSICGCSWDKNGDCGLDV